MTNDSLFLIQRYRLLSTKRSEEIFCYPFLTRSKAPMEKGQGKLRNLNLSCMEDKYHGEEDPKEDK